MTTHGRHCTCFICLTEGPLRCSTSCVLRAGHPGRHMGWLSFARLFAREVRKRIGQRIAGSTNG